MTSAFNGLLQHVVTRRVRDFSVVGIAEAAKAMLRDEPLRLGLVVAALIQLDPAQKNPRTMLDRQHRAAIVRAQRP